MFPIQMTAEGFQRVASIQIGDVSPQVHAVIEQLQPFHGKKPDKHPLFLLHELNRIDKHRILNTVVGNTHRVEAVWTPGANIGLVEDRVVTAPPEGFAEGAQIARFRFGDSRRCSEANVKFVLHRDVWFGEGPARHASAFWLLQRITEAVHGAIAKLEKFLIGQAAV
jgi:hypothetical protein